jgi:hypothetical protein
VDIARAGNSVRNWRRLLRPGGYVLAFDGVWSGLPVEFRRPEGYFERFYSVEVRAAIPACTSTQWIRSSRCSGAPVLLAHQPGPTMSKFAIIAQTGYTSDSWTLIARS